MVGYQADDPPVRYLLEALEADRERDPDLNQVYAFVPARADNHEEQRALWYAKGVEPILYTPLSDGDHSPLYDTLKEWCVFADNPTAWRREALRKFISKKPEDLDQQTVAEVVSLLAHGDASQLLGELSPDSSWLTELEKRKVREFLSVWPQEVQHEVALIRTVSRSLVDTLEEAEDAGFPSDAPPVEHHNVIYASGTPCETLLSPGEQPCAPLLRYCWRRGLLKSHLRSIVVPWTDLRQPVDIIREELDARRAALLRQLR